MPKSFRNCEIMQQSKYLNNGIDAIKKVLDTNDSIEKYAYILHNSDLKADGTLKEPHYHIAIAFKTPRRVDTISNLFGVPEQYISGIKGRWGDMLSYLTHSNAPEKFQYPAENVVSNFDFELESKDTTKSRKQEQAELDEVILKIISGDIRKYNYTKHISPNMYIKYNRQIEQAFKFRADSIKGVDRQMQCVYITGDSGTGKTTYAKEYAKKKGYSIFVSSGSNDVLDGYDGEDCIILDDLRPSCLGLSDLLKLLDNNTSSTVKSRYKNKVLECKVIIITTTLDINEFFRNVFSDEPETIVQLKRRCGTMISFPKNVSDKLTLKVYDPVTRDYILAGEIPNPLPKFVKQEITDTKQTINEFTL